MCASIGAADGILVNGRVSRQGFKSESGIWETSGRSLEEGSVLSR